MGRIFAIKRFEIHDGDGIRTTLFLKGCPLRCLWCHNPEGLTYQPVLSYYPQRCVGCGMCQMDCPAGAHKFQNGQHTLDRSLCLLCGKCAQSCAHGSLVFYGQDVTPQQILPRLLEDRAFYGTHGGVTLSGGEPLMQEDFCVELLHLLKEEGINTAVDTCGMVPRRTYERVLPLTDQFLFDIKAADSKLHERLTGCSNEQILDNLTFLNNTGARIEVRIPLIPGENENEIPAIGKILCGMEHVQKVKVLGFHNLAVEKYASLDQKYAMGDTAPAENDRILRAVETLQQMGIHACS